MKFVDLHIHGAFGIDVLNASTKDLDLLAQGLEAQGYGSFLPTLIPLHLDRLETVLDCLGSWMASRIAHDGRGAMPLGLHFEGPFISPKCAGVLDPGVFLDAGDDRTLTRFLGLVDSLPGQHMITLAPEIKGGLELVSEFTRRGFLVSMGHTDADLPTLEQATNIGARHMTHFCNAMRPFHHRAPGPIGFGLQCDDVSVDVIADLNHLHPTTLKLILKAKRPDRLVLISDAIPVAGKKNGTHELWGRKIIIADSAAHTEAGQLAGSVQLLHQCVKNMETLGMPPVAARAAASTVALQVLQGAS